jgi:hypothetical protein
MKHTASEGGPPLLRRLSSAAIREGEYATRRLASPAADRQC